MLFWILYSSPLPYHKPLYVTAIFKNWIKNRQLIWQSNSLINIAVIIINGEKIFPIFHTNVSLSSKIPWSHIIEI